MKNVNLFLDSGAFTASTHDQTISVEKYIAYVKKHEQYISYYANLDTMGNEKESWENQRKMEKAGLHPLPVFHLGDDFSYLDRCMEYPYFCLGGLTRDDCSQASKIAFLDACWNIICDTPSRNPKNRVHGLGIASFDLAFRYPWHSIDSSTWLMLGRFGSITVPLSTPRGYSYHKKPLVIGVSKRRKTGKHINDLSRTEKNYIVKYLDSIGFQLGESEFAIKDGKKREVILISGVCNEYKQRDEVNSIFLHNAQKESENWDRSWKLKRPTGFGMKR
jgi:hypothetical protein